MKRSLGSRRDGESRRIVLVEEAHVCVCQRKCSGWMSSLGECELELVFGVDGLVRLAVTQR